ncbi:calpain-2 catalytic subunit-like protein [Labeo rohita]|uniref:Calpain-2 catalytic subunit-like protein n=1 Tax=Labeo rohita TaxID=84645 RepID=A0A498NU93_LABRO|nr:calpain-2 catalytic subunit-like protein [Labeo rohita]
MSNIAKVLSRRQERGEGVGTNKKAIPFKKQDYQSLKQECLAKRTLFCDPTFPAESSSLGYNELGPQSPDARGVQWKRPKSSSRAAVAPAAVHSDAHHFDSPTPQQLQQSQVMVG